MALNFSQRPIFPAHLSEDNLADPIRISNGYLVEGIPENNLDAFGKPWHPNCEVEDCFDYGRDRYDRSGSQESASNDIIDLLPSDPFGMDISSTFTAITGWLEDLEADYGAYGSNDVGVSSGDYQLFAGLNFIWNNAMRFQAFQGNMAFNYRASAPSRCGGCSDEKGARDVSCPVGFGSACNTEGISSGFCSEEKGVGDVSCPVGFGSACKMEEITSGYVGCSEENGVGDCSCPVGFAPTCNMEEITGGYGGSSEEKGVIDMSTPVGFGSACNMEDITSGCGGCLEEKGDGDLSCTVNYGSACNVEDILSCHNESTDILWDGTEEWSKGCFGTGEACLNNVDGEAPHLVLGLAIGYLGVRDLLSVESVCRYLRGTIKSEPYLWTKIHIDQPLNEKITDELLLQLTDRAQGELRCLSLVECPRITDDGLKRVLESNPKLTKLSVPGCSKLTIEGIVNNLKAFNSAGLSGIKHLKIGALYGVEKYFEELKLLLGIDSNLQQNVRKPYYYHTRHFYLSCDDDDDDDRALDIEMCPKCQKLRLIYDCTAEACQRKEQSQSPQVCRACTLCIERCFKCGRCINDGEYEETFCLDWLCSVCKRQEELAKSVPPPPSLAPRL